jgi:tetratricopeptide (TPR) repeat protein
MRAIRPAATDPSRWVYRTGPARLLQARGKHAEAVEALKPLVNEAPSEPSLRYALAEALERANRGAEAEPVLKEGVALRARENPRDNEPRLRLAALYERLGRWEDAAAAYEEALKADPSGGTARIGLRRARERQKQPERAAAFLEDLALRDPAAPDFQTIWRCATCTGRRTGRSGWPRSSGASPARIPKNRAALTLYAQALAAAKQWPEAEAVYRQMIDPGAAPEGAARRRRRRPRRRPRKRRRGSGRRWKRRGSGTPLWKPFRPPSGRTGRTPRRRRV